MNKYIFDVDGTLTPSRGVIDEQFHDIWHKLEHAKKENKLDEDDKNLTEKQ